MFLYPAIAAGFAFLVVPPLVHLINMLRHRRQRWAAMDFLLASYRRQRKWVRLRQFLLLLSRIAVAALLVAMLSGWTGSGPVASLVGGGSHHHVVVLDDSVSMASGGQRNAYAKALSAVAELVRRVSTADGTHRLTVIRTSRAALSVGAGNASADAVADVAAGTVTAEGKLIDPLMATGVSTMAVSPEAAVELAVALVDRIAADETHFYVASDFLQRDWSAPDKIVDSLAKLPDETEVRLIDCGDANASRANLAITALTPNPDVWVAGVPVVMRMTVRNFGDRDAGPISPTFRLIQYPSSITSIDPTETRSGIVEDIPAAAIVSIPAGEEVTRTFQVFVPQSGTHAVEVSIPPDALEMDNTRACTLPLSEAEKVLIVDGGVEGRGALAISTVLDPGSQVRIGAVPEVRSPAFLRDATVETLSNYRAIYLCELESISETTAEALSQYVRDGGGLAIFVGEDANPTAYNDHLHSRGLLPGRLDAVKPLDDVPPVQDDGSIDTRPAQDVVFGSARSAITDPLRSLGDVGLSLVAIKKSWSVELQSEQRGENPSERQGVGRGNGGDGPRPTDQRGAFKTLLQRRDGLPWITSSDLGRGRVVAALTGLSDSWTNWAGDPTFVVFMLQTNAELYSGAAPEVSRAVTDRLTLNPGPNVDPAQSTIRAATYYPPTSSTPRSGIEILTEADGKMPEVDPASVFLEAGASLTQFTRIGIGEWSFENDDGSGAVVPVATVLDPSDGDLARVDPPALVQSLVGVNATLVTAAVWSEQNNRASSSTLTMILLVLLAIFLAMEQCLAYWASYHAPGAGAGAGAASPGSVATGMTS